MSLPIIIVARLLNLKIYLVEPNSVLGRSNRFFLKSCKKIFCYTYEIKNFPDDLKYKIQIINPLVQKRFYKLKSKDDNKSKFTLLIVGGSQSANILIKTKN